MQTFMHSRDLVQDQEILPKKYILSQLSNSLSMVTSLTIQNIDLCGKWYLRKPIKNLYQPSTTEKD